MHDAVWCQCWVPCPPFMGPPFYFSVSVRSSSKPGQPNGTNHLLQRTAFSFFRGIDRAWTQTFFSQTFGRPLRYPAKITGYPTTTFVFPGFRIAGHTDFFGPHRFAWKTPTPPEAINCEIALRAWNFQARWKSSSKQPTKPLFFVGNSEGQDWTFQAKLNFSSEIEKFKRHWNFSIFGPLGSSGIATFSCVSASPKNPGFSKGGLCRHDCMKVRIEWVDMRSGSGRVLLGSIWQSTEKVEQWSNESSSSSSLSLHRFMNHGPWSQNSFKQHPHFGVPECSSVRVQSKFPGVAKGSRIVAQACFGVPALLRSPPCAYHHHNGGSWLCWAISCENLRFPATFREAPPHCSLEHWTPAT